MASDNESTRSSWGGKTSRACSGSPDGSLSLMACGPTTLALVAAVRRGAATDRLRVGAAGLPLSDMKISSIPLVVWRDVQSCRLSRMTTPCRLEIGVDGTAGGGDSPRIVPAPPVFVERQ